MLILLNLMKRCHLLPLDMLIFSIKFNKSIYRTSLICCISITRYIEKRHSLKAFTINATFYVRQDLQQWLCMSVCPLPNRKTANLSIVQQNTEALQHCGTVAPQHCSPAAQLHCTTIALHSTIALQNWLADLVDFLSCCLKSPLCLKIWPLDVSRMMYIFIASLPYLIYLIYCMLQCMPLTWSQSRWLESCDDVDDMYYTS